MFLFEHLIKLLMGNSDTLFMGLAVVIFGYYGWLLYNINDNFKKLILGWDNYQDSLKEIKERMDELDESVYKELINKINGNINDIEELNKAIKNNTSDMDRYKDDIIDEIKESADEIKEIMKILMNNRSRSLAKLDASRKDNQKNKESNCKQEDSDE